jgi:hypothetical protein
MPFRLSKMTPILMPEFCLPNPNPGPESLDHAMAQGDAHCRCT